MSNSNPDPATMTAAATSSEAGEPMVITASSASTTDSSSNNSGSRQTAPQSPTRSQQGASVSNSPAVTSADQSPVITPAQKPGVGQWQQQQQQQQQTNHGVVLGLEQLERQQDEAERRRKREQSNSTSVRRPQQQQLPQRQTQAMHNTTSPIMMQPYLEDDDHTAPTSMQDSGNHRGDHSLATDTGSTSLGSGDDAASAQQWAASKIEKMIQKTRKRLSSNDFFQRRRSSGEMEDPAEDEEGEPVDALIYGHLQKLGRNGKWQTRWFETDGQCLSYYKTSKRSKLLATLDLEKVGAIFVNEDDPKGCTFTIQVLGRPYYLRAASRAACKDWVITLNRVKEARLQQGNVKLITANSGFRGPRDFLSRNLSTYSTPGVVAVANRQRTRAVDEATIENMEDMGQMDPNNPESDSHYYQGDDSFGGSLSDIVLARWQKRKGTMSRLASKLARWARSLNKYNCNNVEHYDVRLDRHVHPPGHDDARKRAAARKSAQRHNISPEAGLPGWNGKEHPVPGKSIPAHIPVHVSHRMTQEDDLQEMEAGTDDPAQHATTAKPITNDDDEDETRELS